MQVLKPIKCQLITSLELSVSFSGIGTMGWLGCRAKMSQVGESMRLKTGKRNVISSISCLIMKTNTLSHAKDSKARDPICLQQAPCWTGSLLVFLVCMKIYFNVWPSFCYILIIKKVGKDKSLSNLKETSQVKITARALALKYSHYEIMHIKVFKTVTIFLSLNICLLKSPPKELSLILNFIDINHTKF